MRLAELLSRYIYVLKDVLTDIDSVNFRISFAKGPNIGLSCGKDRAIESKKILRRHFLYLSH